MTTLKLAPESTPTTVKLVEVSVVILRETTLTLLPVRVIDFFLSSSFKNTGVVAPLLYCKSDTVLSVILNLFLILSVGFNF